MRHLPQVRKVHILQAERVHQGRLTHFPLRRLRLDVSP